MINQTYEENSLHIFISLYYPTQRLGKLKIIKLLTKVYYGDVIGKI